jgi:DNA-binding beta-propeller fold protein YncE
MQPMRSLALAITALAALPMVVWANGPGEHTLSGPVAVAWEAGFDGPESGSDTVASMVLSPNGKSLFVTGTLTTGVGQQGLWPTTAFGTIAYETRTGKQLWLAPYESPLGQPNRAVDLDVSRNGKLLVVTGYVRIGLGSGIATVGLDPRTGRQLWEAAYSVDPAQRVTDVVVSPDSSRVFITGSRNAITPGGFINGYPDYLTVSFHAENGDVLWHDVYHGESDLFDGASTLAVSPDGRVVYVTGSSGTGAQPHIRSDIATLAYDAATGERRWVSRYPSLPSHSAQGEEILLSPNGRMVYVAAGYQETTEPWTEHVLLIAHDAATGTERWVATQTVGGAAPVHSVLSPDGRQLFVVASDYRDETDLSDFRVMAYDAIHGTQLWDTTYGAGVGQSEYAWDLTLSQNGREVIVTGQSGTPPQPMRLPDDPPPPPIVRFYATVAFDARTGDQLWAARYLGPVGGHSSARSVAISRNGRRVFVTGHSKEGSGFDGSGADYFTVAYDALRPHQEPEP